MRDPNRIKPMLEALERLWVAKPDLRLGQLVVNIAAGPGDTCPGVFSLEDDAMMQRILAELAGPNNWVPPPCAPHVVTSP